MDFAGPNVSSSHRCSFQVARHFDVEAATTEIPAKKTGELISRFGILTEIVTDIGTQFTSSEFQQLCQKCRIRHVTSPPFHSQLNGQAECFVDNFKRAMIKIWNAGFKMDFFNTFLLAYRTTPKNDLGGQTPVERFGADNLMYDCST
ncbi:unnamed protein product [Schistocephalus solidus]|uniref:Integrase catalytic domain-containing protein n=1 Tax=Schistocephalus solidus TaxID=70667 RepID=A0A183SQ92_SCHSO|nr:unnamed protein product [Schistocephalus solidus]